MINTLRNISLEKWLYAAFLATILIFFAGDVGRNLAMGAQHTFIRYTAVTKGIVLALYVVVFILNFKRYWKEQRARKWMFALALLLLTFLVSQNTGSFAENGFSGIKKSLVYISRFLYLPVSFLLFYPLLSHHRWMQRIFRWFEWLFFLNCAFIVMGAIFDIEIFRTYRHFSRFGYMGMYNSNNQASYYFMLMIIFYYHQVLGGSKPYKLILVIACSLLLGTKKMYLFLPLLFVYDFIRARRYRNIWIWAALLGAVTTSYLLRDRIFRFAETYFEALTRLYKQEGIITALSSTRNIQLAQTIENLVEAKWQWYNFIIGGAEFYNNRPEMELFDIYFFFGLVGLIAYFWFYKDIMSFFNNHRFLWAMLFILLLLGTLASGFIISANQPVVFLLVFSLIAFANHNSRPTTN